MQFRQRCSMWWLAPLVVALDRLTKLWSLSLRGPARAIPGVLNVQGVRNYGAAFGLFSGRMALIVAVVLILSAAVVVILFRYPNMPRVARAGLWLVLAGGLSNLYDRIAYGYVIDFLEFAFVRFPVFNVADIAIVVGCALCFLEIAVFERRRGNG